MSGPPVTRELELRSGVVRTHLTRVVRVGAGRLDVQLRATQPLFVDAYADNRETGSFILVDESTNKTVAAGMLRRLTTTY